MICKIKDMLGNTVREVDTDEGDVQTFEFETDDGTIISVEPSGAVLKVWGKQGPLAIYPSAANVVDIGDGR